MDFQFTPIRFDNEYHIRDSVFSILRNAILDGKLKPGQHLVERDIAAQLNISRTPVREAIQKLESEQLVEHIPRRGVFVTGFTPEDVREIELIRMALESLCCSIAAKKITKTELDKLISVNNAMLKAARQGNLEKSTALNRQFHEAIYKAAKSPHLYYFVSTMREYISRFTRVSYTKPGRMQEVYDEHNELIDCLRAQDSDGAYAAAKKHIEISSETFLEMAY